MSKHQLKIRKILKSFGMFSILLGISNSNVYSGYLSRNQLLINEKSASFDLPINNFLDTLLATDLVNGSEEVNTDSEVNVLISEIVIQGWEDHPEGRKLELVAYDSMSIKPGSIINNEILKKDLDSIYASGLFSGVNFKAEDGPLGVKLIVKIVPNPIFRQIIIQPSNKIITQTFVNKIFEKYYGSTLNLNELQESISLIKKMVC